jgi:hypothetical protein
MKSQEVSKGLEIILEDENKKFYSQNSDSCNNHYVVGK